MAEEKTQEKEQEKETGKAPDKVTAAKATPTVDKSVTDKATLKLSQKVSGTDIFWKTRSWDAKLQSFFVLANYPANQNLLADDLTGMLIQNQVINLGGGSVTIGNLFTRAVPRVSERALRDAYSEDSMNELVGAALKHDRIIVAVGSLTDKSEVARHRLKDFLERLEAADKRVEVLVAFDTLNLAHPLSGGVRASGAGWQIESVKKVGLMDRLVEQIGNEKPRATVL
jgi:hypothetical protein